MISSWWWLSAVKMEVRTAAGGSGQCGKGVAATASKSSALAGRMHSHLPHVWANAPASVVARLAGVVTLLEALL
jgi:hypothetical protein